MPIPFAGFERTRKCWAVTRSNRAFRKLFNNFTVGDCIDCFPLSEIDISAGKSGNQVVRIGDLQFRAFWWYHNRMLIFMLYDVSDNRRMKEILTEILDIAAEVI